MFLKLHKQVKQVFHGHALQYQITNESKNEKKMDKIVIRIAGALFS